MTTESLIMRAARFARDAHAGQYRKYTKLPYITHPARVAGRVAVHPFADEEMVAAALLHDVVEDTPCTLEQVKNTFGTRVSQFVAELTKPEAVPAESRLERKQRELEHAASASHLAKIIKLLDRIDNFQDMSAAPSDFVERYCQETRQLANAIGDADSELKQELLDSIERLSGQA